MGQNHKFTTTHLPSPGGDIGSPLVIHGLFMLTLISIGTASIVIWRFNPSFFLALKHYQPRSLGSRPLHDFDNAGWFKQYYRGAFGRKSVLAAPS